MISLFGTDETRPAMTRFRTFVVLVGGVLLPIVTVMVEAMTHMCAEAFFDPIPTLWHLAAAALVPAVHALAYVHLRDDRPAPAWLGWAQGFTLALSAFYALVFVPVMTIAVFALVFFGLGLLPLTPALSLLAALRLARAARAAARAHGRPLPGLGRSALLLLPFLLLVDARPMVTRLGLHWALSSDAAVRERGISWLRRVGSEKELRRQCYPRAARPSDLFWIFGHVASRGLARGDGQRAGADARARRRRE